MSKSYKMQKYIRNPYDDNVSKSVAAYPSLSLSTTKNIEQRRLEATRNDIKKEIEKRRGMSLNIQKNMLKNSHGAVMASTPQKQLVDFAEFQGISENSVNSHSVKAAVDRSVSTGVPPIAYSTN